MTTIGVPPIRRWRSLTAEIGDSRSPVGNFLKDRFPRLGLVQQAYRDGVGPLVIPGGAAHPGTLGGAFDWAVRFLLHPYPSPGLALRRAGRGLRVAAGELAARLGMLPEDRGLDSGRGRERFDGPVAGSVVDEETLLRGCWALALLTEIYRLGGVRPGSPLVELDQDNVRAADLLALAPTSALEELRQLCQVARTALPPRLAARCGLWALGPAFDGSRLMDADADVIAAGLLVEVKTGLGDKRSDGSRRAGLDGPTMRQLLGYVLLDFSDEFELDSIGLYAARYGNLTVWPLSELLDELAGRPVDLATEREAFRALLESGRP